mgnify:CR=1 FL=1
MTRICIAGLGYIGLPTAALLANRGFFVHGVDVIPSVVSTINKGEIHIIEPELDTFVRSAVQSGKLTANLVPALADVFIIAVPTPFKENKEPDLSYVFSAAKAIAPFLRAGNLVILESTSPIGTTQKIKDLLESQGINVAELFIAYCPERVLPGHVMKELIENDRIVGGLTPEATDKVASFYKKFVSGEVLKTEAKTAELCKLAENSYRDTNIAFANELSLISDAAGVDVWELIKLANKHPRVNILQPGTGVGGHCIAVDPWFIISAYPEQSKLIRCAREINTYKTEWVIEKISLEAKRISLVLGRAAVIAVYGLSFKPDIDDLRESPAIHVYTVLKAGHSVLAVEPHVKSHATIKLVDLNQALDSADLHVFLVAHKQFKTLNLEGKTVLDFCNLKK